MNADSDEATERTERLSDEGEDEQAALGAFLSAASSLCRSVAFCKWKQDGPSEAVLNPNTVLFEAALRRCGNRIKLDRDAEAEVAGVAANDAAISIPAAVRALRREEDGDPLAGFNRQIGNGA